MKRLFLLTLCALLLAFASLGDVCALDAGAAQRPTDRPAQKTKKTKTGKKQADTIRSARAKDLLSKSNQPRLTREDLSKPYSAGSAFGPPKPPAPPEEDNATRWDYDPAPKARPFAKPKEPSPVNFRFGREEVVDPLNRKDVTSKPDPTAAKESLKNMDLKGALDKVGGKAEVQVDILKF